MAVAMGAETQRAFFDKIGFLKPLNTQLTELAAPLYPRHWMTINTMTIAFGHGISVTPLHLATGTAAVVNGGTLYAPSLVKRNAASDPGRLPNIGTDADHVGPAQRRDAVAIGVAIAGIARGLGHG